MFLSFKFEGTISFCIGFAGSVNSNKPSYVSASSYLNHLNVKLSWSGSEDLDASSVINLPGFA